MGLYCGIEVVNLALCYTVSEVCRSVQVFDFILFISPFLNWNTAISYMWGRELEGSVVCVLKVDRPESVARHWR